MSTFFNILDIIAYIVAAGSFVILLLTYLFPDTDNKYVPLPGKFKQCTLLCFEYAAKVMAAAIKKDKKDN